jgi:copper homeostasis protein CutC
MPFFIKKILTSLRKKKIQEEIKKKKKVIQKERNKIANFDSMVSSGTNKGNTLTE